MVTIFCTKKLLKRTGFSAETLLSEPTTTLGNWHANILFFRHLQILLFVNDKSRLAVITPAREVKSLANHLTHHLSVLLERLGLPSAMIDAEVREMGKIHFAATRSKSVLGTMVDYKIQIEAMLEDPETMSPLEMSVFISTMPVGPLGYGSPGEVALELLMKKTSSG